MVSGRENRHSCHMPGLEELGWLQFERLCELVLEADAGVDPTRWEGSADVARQLVSEDELEVNGRRARAARARALHVVPRPGGRAAAVALQIGRDVRQPAGRWRRRLRRAGALRGDPAPAGAADEAAVGALARRRAARSRRARPLDGRHRGHARAGQGLRSDTGVAARGGDPEGASLPRPDRPAGDGQDRDRADARPGAADRGLGGARVHQARADRGALRSLQAAAVHRRRRVRLDRVPRGRRRALGGEPRPHPEGHRRAPLARLDLPPRAAARRAAAAAPRARGRALPAARGGPGRRVRAGRGGEDADPVPARARGAPGPGAPRDHPRRSARRSSSTRTSRPSGSAASSRAARRWTGSSAS